MASAESGDDSIYNISIVQAYNENNSPCDFHKKKKNWPQISQGEKNSKLVFLLVIFTFLWQ